MDSDGFEMEKGEKVWYCDRRRWHQWPHQEILPPWSPYRHHPDTSGRTPRGERGGPHPPRVAFTDWDKFHSYWYKYFSKMSTVFVLNGWMYFPRGDGGKTPSTSSGFYRLEQVSLKKLQPLTLKPLVRVLGSSIEMSCSHWVWSIVGLTYPCWLFLRQMRGRERRERQTKCSAVWGRHNVELCCTGILKIHIGCV